MSNNNAIEMVADDYEDDFECGDLHSHDEDASADMMRDLIEISAHQTMMAIELTKLIVDKSASQTMTEEQIFASFKKSLEVVAETSPITKMLGDLSSDE